MIIAGSVMNVKDNQVQCPQYKKCGGCQLQRMSYVELSLNEYAPLILSSRDDGVIIDPNVGASLCLTRDHIEMLQQQVEMFNNMMENLGDFIPGEQADKEESIDDLLNMPPEEKKKKGLFGKKKK